MRTALRRAMPGVVLTAGLSTVLVLGLLGAGYAPAAVSGFSRQVWLESSAVGQVARLDGSSADVMARVPVAGAGSGLQVAPVGKDALVVDRASGTVRRVSAATLAAGPRVAPLPKASSGLSVLTGGGAVWAVDSASGVAARLDPKTLAAGSTTFTVPAGVDRRTAVVADDGRLWLLDPGTGAVSWLDGMRRHGPVPVASAGSSLTLVDGRPMVVDAGHGVVLALDPQRGAIVSRVGLEADVTQQPQVVGSRQDLLAVAASDRASLVLVRPRHGDVRSVPLSSSPVRLGAPVVSAGRVFVPDLITGTVYVVDASQGSLVTTERIPGGGAASLELVSQDDVVFYNDPASQRAGVIRQDGSSTPISKYRSDGGPSKPSQASPRPNTPKPSPRPNDSDVVASGLSIVLSTAMPVAGQQVGLAVRVAGAGLPARAQWSFGDGATVTGPVGVTHAWATPGRYRIFVTATTATGRTLSATRWVTVTGRPPATGSGGGGGTPEGATHTVTVTDGGGGSVRAVVAGQSRDCTASPCTFTVRTPVRVDLTAAAASGYRLSSWGAAACPATATTCSFTATADRAVTVTFAAVPPAGHTLTLAASTGGRLSAQVGTAAATDCTSGCVLPVPAGAPVTLTAAPADESYRVTDWGLTGCDPASSTCTTTPSSDSTATVTFTQAHLTVSAPTVAAGAPACPSDVAVSATLTADAPGTISYTWTGATPGTGTVTFTRAGSRTVTGQIHATTVGSGTVGISASIGSASAPVATTSYSGKCTDTTRPVLSVSTRPAEPIEVLGGDTIAVTVTASDPESPVTASRIWVEYYVVICRDGGCTNGSTQSATVATAGSGSVSGSWVVPMPPLQDGQATFMEGTVFVSATSAGGPATQSMPFTAPTMVPKRGVW